MKKIILSAAVLTAAFAQAQNTGIGTTNPQQKLDIVGNQRLTGDIYLQAPSSGTDSGDLIFMNGPSAANPGKIVGRLWSVVNGSGLNFAGHDSALSPFTSDTPLGQPDMQILKSGEIALYNVLQNDASTNVLVYGTDGKIGRKPISALNTIYNNSITNIINGSTIERAALTGDVTAAQNSNATTIAANAVTSSKIADGTIAAADLSSMGATAAGQNLVWNGTAWVPTTPTAANSQNIYTEDGQVTADRTVDVNAKKLSFTNANSIGLGTIPTGEYGLEVGTLSRISGDMNLQYKSNSTDSPDILFRTGSTAATPNKIIGRIWANTTTNGLNFGGHDSATDPSVSGADMVIDAAGNVGIGTTAPAAKLEINNGSVPGALKIVDGTQAAGKVLVSDANGVGTWQINTGAQNALYQNLVCNATSDVLLPSGEEVTLPGFTPITLPNAGKYLIIFHSFFQNRQASGTKSFYVRTYLNGNLYKNEETYAYVESDYYFNNHYSVVVPVTTPNTTIEIRVTAKVGGDLVVNSAPSVGSYRNNADIIYLGN